MMGVRNVALCFTSWPSLPHGAFRLLSGMALQALDSETKEGRPPRVYFGGEDAMVELVGGSRRSMYDALKTLRQRGAVDVLDSGRSRHRAVYRLNLDPSQGAESRTQLGADSRQEGCEISHVQGARFRTPRKDVGEQGITTGETSPSVTTSPGRGERRSNDADSPDETYSKASRALLAIHGERTHELVSAYRTEHPECGLQDAVIVLADRAKSRRAEASRRARQEAGA